MFLASVAALAACGSSNDASGKATGSACPPTQTLTYANFGESFVSGYCLRCHSGRESPDLSSAGAVRAHASEIDMAAASGPNATNTTMPEGGGPTVEERAKLGEWLACGAP